MLRDRGNELLGVKHLEVLFVLAEARGVTPAHEHPDKIIVDLALFLEHGEHVGAEDLGQGRQVNSPRHDVKRAVPGEQAVCDNQMDMRVPLFGIITESMYGHDRAEQAIRKTDYGAQEGEQAFIDAVAEFGEQVSVVLEIPSSEMIGRKKPYSLSKRSS